MSALYCQRCKTACSTKNRPKNECACCQRYGTRTAGGTRSLPTISGGVGLFAYDPSAPGHIRQ